MDINEWFEIQPNTVLQIEDFTKKLNLNIDINQGVFRGFRNEK